MNWIVSLVVLGVFALAALLYVVFSFLCWILDICVVAALNKEFDKEMKKGRAWQRTPKYNSLLKMRGNVLIYASVIFIILIAILSSFIPTVVQHMKLWLQ